MAGQNRSSYARSSNGANRGLAAFFRGAFILLVALTLSFGLGFFVIARMVPTSAPDAVGNGGSGDGSNGLSTGAGRSDQRTPHANAVNPAPQVAAKTALHNAPAQDGPVILPETEVQKPGSVETNGGNSNSNQSNEADKPNSILHGGAPTDNGASGSMGSAASTGVETGDSAGHRRSRRSRTSDADAGTVQPAESPDSTGAQSVDSSTTATADTPPTARSGIYRVQIGVYSTREKAEEIARSASDKGIRTTLHVVNQDGRTLYRVQRSTHRDRAKAECDRQSLIDAGFDATIINPSK